MDWKLHVIFSFLPYVLLISIFRFPFDYSLQAILLLVFGSLLPDMDHPKSMIRKLVFLLVFYLAVLLVVVGLEVEMRVKVLAMGMVLVLTYYLYKNIPLKHRGKRSLHLWRYVFISGCLSSVLFAVANINISLALFLIVGYASHLLADKIGEF